MAPAPALLQRLVRVGVWARVWRVVALTQPLRVRRHAIVLVSHVFQIAASVLYMTGQASTVSSSPSRVVTGISALVCSARSATALTERRAAVVDRRDHVL